MSGSAELNGSPTTNHDYILSNDATTAPCANRKGPHAAAHAADLSASRSRGERPRLRGPGHLRPRHDDDAGALQQRHDHEVVIQVVMQTDLPRRPSPRKRKSPAEAGL